MNTFFMGRSPFPLMIEVPALHLKAKKNTIPSGKDDRMKTYYFIRHGASESDVGNTLVRDCHDEMHTRIDWPLSQRGRRQAVQVGKKLRELDVEIVLSSTLSRTVETAEIAARESGRPYAGGWEPLNEVIMGRMPGSSGHPAQAAAERETPNRQVTRPFWPLIYRSMAIAYLLMWTLGKTKGGETRGQVHGRIDEVFRRLQTLPQERIALVGHGYWILFLARFLRQPGKTRLPLIPAGGWVANGSFTKVCQSGGNRKLEYFSVPYEKVRC
jgi:broad specificity phosphatase PhoE